MWLIWRHNAHIWAWKFTWPHGEKNRHTKSSIHIVHIVFNDACAVLPKTCTLRSHVNGVVGSCADRLNGPQVPRIRVSLFSRRPTTHAQTMKRSPRPLASLKVHEKTHCIEVNINLFLMNIPRKAWLQVGRVWGPNDVTPIFFFTNLMSEQQKGCLFPGWRGHVFGVRPQNAMMETGARPGLDSE